uniref:Uncharacterized protein n=1 Tax=Picea glauca TaxID=3330 RepID=A0A101LXG2_PICGL|nr:hypothetical protein ABT39_MTgene6148 [Picea glauca]QHR88795.1 hypothetical protein Q903MT_gene2810 [Picea sitchensis]
MIEPNQLLLHLYLYLTPMLLVCLHIDQKPIHRSITISRINSVFPCYLCRISCSSWPRPIKCNPIPIKPLPIEEAWRSTYLE